MTTQMTTQTHLKNQHALVTGGGRGIGAAIAEKLARAGMRLTIVGRDEKTLQSQAAQLREITTVHTHTCDVTKPDSIALAFASASQTLGPISVLVNNAGQAESQAFIKTDLALWQKMLDVNLTSAFLCSQTVLPEMLETGWGRIVNVASTAGLVGYAYIAAYVAAKHGMVGLTKALAMELIQKNITVNAVCPGYTETDIVQAAIATIVEKTGRSQTEARHEIIKHNPQRRIVQPEEVAETVLWLCQPNSGSVTGQAIAIAGGEVMR